MKKKKITPKSNITAKTDARVVDYHRDMGSWREMPVSSNHIKSIGIKLVEWATHNNDAYKLSQFAVEQGITMRAFERWVKINDFFAECYEHAKMILGNRREVKGLKKEISENIVIRSMHFYDPDWKNSEEWRAKLKLDSEGHSTTKIVVLEKYPELDKDGNRNSSTSK